jgi:predicted nucleic acid-binding protein
MRTIYLESSAFLAWVLSEPRAAEVKEAIEAAPAVVTSELTVVETHRALVRAESQSTLTEGDAQRLRGMLRRVTDSWIRMEIFEEVLARAARPFPVEPVRTLDALHLATALEFAQAFPDLRILSYDDRILANARPLGLE